ncbi:MAG: hypothetical protein QOE35_596 [Actinomycetota bacterium]|jgi:hypothetical protein
MNVKRIPSEALDRYLTLVKSPLDLVARRTRREGDDVTSAFELLLDRVDAGVRDAAGRLLGDEALQDDARKRRLAAAERERALRLKAEAAQRTEQADQEFAQRQRAAEDRRQQAERRAEEEKRRIEQEKQAKERQVEQTAAERKAANRKVASTVEGAVDDRANRSRLQQLETEAEALREEEEALAAKSTAKQLATAAAKTKAARKNGS